MGGGLILSLNKEIPCKFWNSHHIVPIAETVCSKFQQLKRKMGMGMGKYPLKWSVANLQFNYTHKSNLLKITKLYRSFSNQSQSIIWNFETDPWDHQKLILMMMKSGIIKGPAKTTIFQAYKRVGSKCSVIL